MADSGLPISELVASSATLGEAASLLAPAAGLLERIYYDDLSIAVDDDRVSVWLSLILDGQVGFDLPGGFAIKLGEGDGVTPLTFGLRVSSAGVAIAVEDLAIALAIPRSLLRPAPPAGGGTVPEQVELVLRGGLTFDESRRLRVEGFESVSLPRSFVGSSEVVLSATDVAIDTARGLILGEARIELPEGLPQLAPEELVLEDAVIGPAGVSARLQAQYTPEFDAITKRFIGRGSGELGGVPFAFTTLAIELRENDLVEGSLAGQLLLPFFEVPTAVKIALRGDGSFSVDLGGETPLVTIEREGLMRLAIAHIGFEVVEGRLRVRTGGSVTLLVGDTEWPSFRADVVVIEANGDIMVHGLGLTLQDGKPLDLGAPLPGAGNTPGVTIDKLDVSGNPLDDGLVVDAELSTVMSGGPFTATLQRLGAHARLVADGAAGKLSAHDLAFRPPLQIALAVESDMASGGGFVDRDPATGRYAGALALTVGTFHVIGAGVLDTRMPDGSDGFSLAVIASARFPSIQLGWGFTLDGLGAFIGAHRTVDVDAIRVGLRDGAAAALLGGGDPVTEAPAMVASLSKLFPAHQGRFVVGPTARIGWGTPALLQADLAVLLELPGVPRIVVLAAVQVGLPTLEHRIVDLRMDVLGVLDLARKTLAVDASLHDSTLAGYALTGDMALHTSWSDQPYFLLAIGGFHPRFTPPPGFPALRRLALTIGDNPRLRLEAYLALTSSTIQLGGRVDLSYRAGGLSIGGHLRFDALIDLRPLHLEVELEAKVSIAYRGHNIASAKLDFLLVGPRPWRAHGTATIGILWWDVSVGFDVTWGDRTPPELPPPPDVAGILRTALSDLSAWSSELTAGERSWLVLRDDLAANALRVHPLASLVVRQRAVPLGLRITAFGTVPLAEPLRFAIVGAHVDASPVTTEPTYDMFSPAQFAALRSDERLAAPSFESMTSGARLQSAVKLGAVTRARMDHDTAVTDPLAPPRSRDATQVTPTLLAAASPQRRPSSGRIRVHSPQFVLASTRDLAITARGAQLAAGQTSYAALREALRAGGEANLQIVPRAETTNAKSRVVVVREDERSRNIDFVDTVTGAAMTRAEFVQEINAGRYPDYAVRRVRGLDTPVSRPTPTTDDNLG